jgi:hypothetical protein
MFVRFRETPYGLQVSLIQTRREGGKVRHEHIAGLGAITVPTSAADRIAFWRRLHDRLSALSNRIVDEQSKILGAVDERIRMPTPDELRDVQLENAKVDQRFWEVWSRREQDISDCGSGVGVAGMAGALLHLGFRITGCMHQVRREWRRFALL